MLDDRARARLELPPRGRQAKEMSRPEENLHLWKMVAEEHGCFDRPFAFANDHARFLFYRDQLSSLHYLPHEDFRCTATLMAGLPGAGKDTWIAKHGRRCQLWPWMPSAKHWTLKQRTIRAK